MGAMGTTSTDVAASSGPIPVEKMRRPTSSSGLNWSSESRAARLARSSLVSPVSGSAMSPIDPETSTTSSTWADFRWRDHTSSSSTMTPGSGTCSSVWGWSGSTPLAGVTGSPTGTSGLPGRKPNSSTRSWFSGRWTKSWKRRAASASASSTHSASRTKNGLSEKSVPSSG